MMDIFFGGDRLVHYDIPRFICNN